MERRRYDMTRIIWPEGYNSLENDPFCGHLWVDRVMEPLVMIIVHKKVYMDFT